MLDPARAGLTNTGKPSAPTRPWHAGVSDRHCRVGITAYGRSAAPADANTSFM